MIYLISGGTRAGKTTLSKKLSRKLKIGYISTDNIRPIILPYVPKKDVEKYFPTEAIFELEDVVGFFTNHSTKKIFEADITEAKTIWPGVKNLIKYLSDCKLDYVIEGVHLLPEDVRQFKNDPNVKIIYLVKRDKEKIIQGLKTNKQNYDWMSGAIEDPKVLEKAADFVKVHGDYFYKEAKKYKLKVINTEDNFSKKINEAIDYLF